MPQPRHRTEDPALTRTGALSHPGTLAVAGAAILFALYVFNVGGTQTFLDSLFSGADQFGKSHNDAVVSFTLGSLPYVVIALGVLILLFVVLWIRRRIVSIQRARLLRKRASQDVQQFTAMMLEHGISAKVATQAYRLLKPHYDHKMRARMDDDLRSGLKMSEADIEALRQRMLHFTDRKNPRGETISSLRTVGDLLLAIEHAPHQSLTQSMAKKVRGTADAPVIRTEAVGETRMVVPLHKRVQQMEKEASAASPEKSISAPKLDANPSEEMILPLHKRRF